MAKPETWEKLRYFKAWENWGDEHAISDDLLLRLDDFRHFVQCPITVTAAVATQGHAGKSFHYRENGACAVDIMLPDYAKGPIELVFDALRFGFTGVGYYPHWHFNGRTVGGLHLDVRPLKWDQDETLNYTHSRWMGVKLKPDSSEQTYIALNYENLIKYGGINGISNGPVGVAPS